MPDELHLVQRLVQRHRRGLVRLVAHDERAVLASGGRGCTVVRWGPDLREHGQVGGHLVEAAGPAAVTTAVGSATKPRLDAGDSRVERGVTIGGGRLGADDGALGARGDLDPLGLGRLTRVGLVRDLDVDAVHAVVVLAQLGELALHVLAKPLRHLGLTTPHHDLHAAPPDVVDKSSR